VNHTHDAEEPRSGARRFRLSDLGAALLLGVIVWHVFASFLWIAPPTPLRQLVPGEALRSYMLPWFGQSWSVFAPDPINGDNEILVRARLDTGVTTDWQNATDIEYALARHNPFPPKAAAMGMHQAAQFLSQWNALTNPQRDVVGRDRRAGADADRTALESSLPADYVDEERRTLAYATLVSRSLWGDEVTEVQFLVQRRGIVTFADRHDTAAERPAPAAAETGWRKPAEVSSEDVEEFASTFRRALDAAGAGT
jgi:hypothetical protein